MQKLLVIFSLIFWGCQTTSPPMDSPPDITEYIEEIKKSEDIPEPKKQKIIQQAQKQDLYSQKAFEKIQELSNRLDKLESENERLKEEIKSLESELETWRTIKSTFIYFLIAIIMAFLLTITIRYRRFFGFP